MGYSAEQRQKRSEMMKQYVKEHPEKFSNRGRKPKNVEVVKKSEIVATTSKPEDKYVLREKNLRLFFAGFFKNTPIIQTATDRNKAFVFTVRDDVIAILNKIGKEKWQLCKILK